MTLSQSMRKDIRQKDETGSEGKMKEARKCIKENEIRVGSFSKGLY